MVDQERIFSIKLPDILPKIQVGAKVPLKVELNVGELKDYKFKWTVLYNGQEMPGFSLPDKSEVDLETTGLAAATYLVRLVATHQTNRDEIHKKEILINLYPQHDDLKKFSEAQATWALVNRIESLTDRTSGIHRTSLQRPTEGLTYDLVLWAVIRLATNKMRFGELKKTLDGDLKNIKSSKDAFYGTDSYDNLKKQMQKFLQRGCATLWDVHKIHREIEEKIQPESISEETVKDYLSKYMTSGEFKTPYLKSVTDGKNFEECSEIQKNRLCSPTMMELIWSYWHEEGMMIQAMNAISLRFQNKSRGGLDPLANMEIHPLRPLSNLLWGWIQDEQHRLTIARRAYEYEHHYGLTLVGKAVPVLKTADSRSKFLEAYHTLLNLCTHYYKELDDATIFADAFPLRNALRDVHLLLAEGAHNQYGDLPWTARGEMLFQQWLLARPEMRDFLRGRDMVPYDESWMQHVDTMKKLQGWTDVTITHFHNLGVWGEQILLSVRHGNWNNSAIGPANAANWAGFWRNEIQGYIHAYRSVTGVDLSSLPTTSRIDAVVPAIHLKRRLETQRMRM